MVGDHIDDGPQDQDYDVTTCVPGDLTAAELERCVTIIEAGDAVDPGSARAELPRSKVVAIARKGDEIVGVGAIKRVRRDYVARIAQRSGVTLASETPELGYVARDRKHRGSRLSLRIVAALLSMHRGPLFATTDHDRMKQTLSESGFVEQGHEWQGKRGWLSLWTKD